MPIGADCNSNEECCNTGYEHLPKMNSYHKIIVLIIDTKSILYLNYMSTAEKYFKAVSTLLLLGMFGLAFYSVVQAEWADLFVVTQALVISAAPYFLEKYFSIYTPYVLRTGFSLFTFSTLILGEIANLYNTVWWWDMLLHAFASAGITIIGFILISHIYRERDLCSSPLLSTFLVYSFAMSLAVLWEVYEFIIDFIFETNTLMQPSNTDTMTDLIVAIIGSLMICFYGYNYLKRQSPRTIVAETIEDGKINNL